MNSENSKTSDAYRLMLNLMDKKDPYRGDNQEINTIKPQYPLHMKQYKKLHRCNKFKYLDQNGVLILNCLMNLTPYQTFRTNLNPPSRSMKH